MSDSPELKMKWRIDEDKYLDRASPDRVYSESGKVTRSSGLVYEAFLPGAAVGSVCSIVANPRAIGGASVEAEVIGFRDKRVVLMPFAEMSGISQDSRVVVKRRTSMAVVSEKLLGRVIDPRGMPLDGKGPILEKGDAFEERALYRAPPSVLERPVISEPMDLGIRAINGLLTCGKGQRVGILAGSGVGKSVLLGMIARNTAAEVNVIALIGERGREVREFIERDLGPEGLKRSVIIVATSDTSPLLRVRGAFLAATVSEYFREQGRDVLMLMDSVTRFSMAQREIGLCLGEPPTQKGYTPSVFSLMPRIFERAGTDASGGSVTGLYTVLVEGDDMDEPIADAARSYLDGHIVLSRRLAQLGHFPSIDVLQSASRVMTSVIDDDHGRWARQVREWIAVHAEAEDLINIGAYVKGTNPKIDQAVAVRDRITAFLRQSVEERSSYVDSLAMLRGISLAGEAFIAERNRPAPVAAPNQTGSARF